MLVLLYVSWTIFAALACSLTVSIAGSQFFDENDRQFFIKGVAIAGDDPLAANACDKYIDSLGDLGANVVRIYSVDPSQNHDDCMNQLNNANIAVLVNLDEETSSSSWTLQIFERQIAILDAFAKYENTMGFVVGSVIEDESSTANAPLIKAAVHDIKAYRNAKGYREIPIGYACNDIRSIAKAVGEYTTCGNTDATVDFFGLDSYSWCGDSTFTQSGYDSINEDLSSLPVPIFFSEDGCNQVQPRTFTDQRAIFGSQMNGDWSGAIIFELYPTVPDYGLLSDTGFTPSRLPDYSYLSSQWATLTPSGVTLASATTKPQLACPTSDSTWQLAANAALPTLSGIESLLSSSGSSPTSSPTSGSNGSGSDGGNDVATGDANTGLSTGAKIGLGVGVPLGVIIVAALFFVFFRRRRTGKQNGSGAGTGYNHRPRDGYQKNELEAGAVAPRNGAVPYQKPELYTETRQVAPVLYRGAELNTNPHHAELNGSTAANAPWSHQSGGYRPYELATNQQNHSANPDEIGRALPPVGSSVGTSTIAVSAVTDNSRQSQTTGSNTLANESLDAELAAEADAAVQELGLINVRKRALLSHATSIGVPPTELEGRKGEEYRRLIEREADVRRRLEEMEAERNAAR